MDKITRIHLAKVPYEIGINAETSLKKYLEAIRRELDPDMADEIMADIEVRITEILSDRKIAKNDVITVKDIDAIREQLGSPEQFTGSEIEDEPHYNEPKKLLRDPDGAYVGGVASGMGAYFAIDPIFVRLFFIILTFFWGFGIFLYILLWLLVPAAKTSSDKLMMRGEPVTAAALQSYRGTAQRTITNLRLRAALAVCYKICRVLFTAFAILFVLALLSSSGFASAILYTQPLRQLYVTYHLNYLLFGLIWLFILTIVGLTVVILMRLWRRGSPTLKIAFIALISTSVLTLAGVAIASPFVVSHYKDQYGGNKLDAALPVHNDTAAITPTNLNLLAGSNLVVSYVTTSQPLHATYKAYPDMGHPAISIVSSKGTITVQASNLTKVVPSCVLNWCQHIYLPVRVTLYGPALDKFTVNGGAELDLSNLVQTNLALTAQNNSILSITNSYSGNFNLSAESGSSIDASDASAQTATINVQNFSNVFGPASSSLNATLPNNCNDTLLELAQSPTTITLNGQPITVQTLNQDNCVSLDSGAPFPPVPSKPGSLILDGHFLHRHGVHVVPMYSFLN